MNVGEGCCFISISSLVLGGDYLCAVNYNVLVIWCIPSIVHSVSRGATNLECAFLHMESSSAIATMVVAAEAVELSLRHLMRRRRRCTQ